MAESCGKTGVLTVKDAKLWNVHAPYLYKLVITIWDGDTLVVFNPANLKALSTSFNGFYNNGTAVTLTDGVLTGYTDA